MVSKMTDELSNTLFGKKDEGTAAERLAFIEVAYPGPKTTAFYDSIEQSGGKIDRPSELLSPEHEARTTLDRAIGRWVVNGSYQEVFQAIEAGYSPQLVKQLSTFTPEEEKLLPLAAQIVEVFDALIERAPKAIAAHFSESVTEQSWQKTLGFSPEDLRLRVGTKMERFKDRVLTGDGEKPEFTSVTQKKEAANFEERFEIIERFYTKTKSEAFYDAIESTAGIKIRRPKEVTKQSHSALEVMERAAGKWIADGSYDDALRTMIPLAIEFHHGLFQPIEMDRDTGIVFTHDEKATYEIAESICAVTGGLLEHAPKAISKQYEKLLFDKVEQRMFDEHPELKASIAEHERNNGMQDGYGLRLQAIVQLLSPLIMSCISFFA